MINRIFEIGFTNKKTGSGLGLPIARQIVEQHKGVIEVESVHGEVSFRVSLPIYHNDDHGTTKKGIHI
jgi:signal transduction histidine kinase